MSWRIYAREAWHELSSGLRGWLVPLLFAGLVCYVIAMLTNAQYLRDMGGASVPRNGALIVYQMMSGQSFWLIFVWAWVFSQIVTRDRAAHLHELVLASPVSLSALLLARFAGALLLACLLGSSSSVALLLVPALAAAGVFPAGTVGPVPYAELAHAWLLFVLPSALGLGAIYLAVTLRYKTAGAAFAAAAVIILAWMAAMVVLRSADVHSSLAGLIDVSGFGEAEHQTKRWTPAQKSRGLLELTPDLLLNRMLWVLLPLGWLGVGLLRLRRESLVLERAQPPSNRAEGNRAAPALRPPSAPVRLRSSEPSWGRALLAEYRWQLGRTLSRWPFLITALIWTLLNLGAPFVHMLGHAEGPLVPRAQLLAPFLMELSYVFVMFIIAGFTGTMARRDQQLGFVEILDATPAPLGVRVLASALAAGSLTLALALLPTISAWLVLAWQVPQAFDPWTPLLFNGLVAAPALLELCALTFAIHALVRSPGLAHGLSMLGGFIAIVNHEVEIVSYPPAQFGIPAHVELSELGGFRPWLASVLALDAFKLAAFALLVACAWLAFARGTALTFAIRVRAAAQRSAGAAGALAVAAAAALVCSGWLLREQLVVRGPYRSKQERDREDAAWEQRFWDRASVFSTTGGEVQVTLDPGHRQANTALRLQGVHATAGRLRGELPTGTRHIEASVDGRPRELTIAHSAFELELGACPESGCEVRLELVIGAEGWGLQDVPPWLHPSGAWLRAVDVAPRLGLNAERALRAPELRRAHGLPERPSAKESAALAPAAGVAAAGHWCVLRAIVIADSTAS